MLILWLESKFIAPIEEPDAYLVKTRADVKNEFTEKIGLRLDVEDTSSNEPPDDTKHNDLSIKTEITYNI